MFLKKITAGVELSKRIKKDDLNIISLFAVFFLFLYFYTHISRIFYSDEAARSWNVQFMEGRIGFDLYFIAIVGIAAFAILVSMFGLNVKRQDLPRLVYVPLCIISLLFGTISVLHYTPYLYGSSEQKDALFVLSQILAYISLGFGILTIWRPAFALNTFIFWFLLTQNSFVILDFVARSDTDWASIAEFGIILSSLIIILNIFEKNKLVTYQGEKPFRHFLYLRSETGPSMHGFMPVEVLFFFLLALHFSNYFWSGMDKLFALPGPTGMWAIANPLYVYVPYMHIYDRIPAMVPEGLEDFYYNIIKEHTPFFLITSAVIQISAICVIFHRRIMTYLSFCYDAFHSFVFLMAGILFYKWMLLNIGIAYVFHKERRRIPWTIRLIFIFICIVPFFAGHLKLYRLAWYDTFQFNKYSIYAIMKDGREVAVPSNFFLNQSMTFSSIGLVNTFDYRYGHVSAWGARTYDDVMKSKTCSKEPLVKTSPELVQQARSKYENYFKQYHRYMLAQYDKNGKLPEFNFYPHHSFSDFTQGNELRSINFNDIISYKLVGTQGCLPIDPTARQKPKIIKQQSWNIDVSGL